MANQFYWLRRVRRTGRETAPVPSPRFDRYEEPYRELLAALVDVAGESALDELGAWMIETTAATGSLPAPATVRVRARTLCSRRGIEVPPDSPLAA